MIQLFRSPYVISFALAIFFAGSAYAYKHFSYTPTETERPLPVIGALESAHTHTSLLVMIGNDVVSFCDKKYMLRSSLVHFEDNDCFVVHKHATGITLPTFFKTIGVQISPSCIVLPEGGKHCNDDDNTLRVVLNGKQMPIEELPYYDLQNNDHILVNFGPEKDALLLLKYNQVPPIPLDVNEPVVVVP